MKLTPYRSEDYFERSAIPHLLWMAATDRCWYFVKLAWRVWRK